MRFFRGVSGIKIIVLAGLLALAGGIVSAQSLEECALGGYTNMDEIGQPCTYGISVNVSYPDGLDESAAALEAVDNLIQLAVQGFFLEATYAIGPYFSGASMEMFYTEYEHGAALKSIVFTVYSDTGGVHGNTYFSSTTIDMIADRELSLEEDIFQPGTDFVAVLQPLVVAQLTEQMGEYADLEWINDGTDEVSDYTAWAINTGSLELFFAPYQVAPYAMGTFQVSIPADDLYAVINPMLIP